jgi:1-acyl-sn-glycerol-3-phosphate acyltransferase
LKKIWAHWIIYSTGIRYKIEYEVPLDKHQAYVICPNHSSYLDIVFTNISFPNYFHFMGKAELLNVPLFRIFFKKMNIAVNRSSVTDSHKAYKRACSDLSKGISIAIFPEATIPECAPNLGPFKNGAFRIAIEQQVPIVPITFLDNWFIFPDNKEERFVVRPGFSKIIVHAPIPTKGLTEADGSQLRKQVFDLIQKTLDEKGRFDRRGSLCGKSKAEKV